jgi:TonB-linked SusC/RagA family outer membrane protein
MEKMLSASRIWSSRAPRFRALGMSVLAALTFSGTALSQQAPVTGVVTSAAGVPLQGVRVRVQGTELRAFTNANGRYTIAAPPDAVLSFTAVGQKAIETPVGGRTTIDVRMEGVAFLEEVVVTAYTEQRRGDITGAVSSVNVESAQRQTSASVLQRLDATVPGVTVVASGSPGGRSTVRIRGISSFQNNDPLYIVDGTPVQDSYINWLNPNDITSIQVLKDASAASIYGSRASNGVVVIETTKRGVAGPPRVTFRARTGMASPVRGYDDFLLTDALAYHEVIKRAYENAGQEVPTNVYGDPNNPTVPSFIWPNQCTPGAGDCSMVSSVDQWGRPVALNESGYSFPNTLIMPGSTGTNWWDAVFSPAPVSDLNLDVSGGGEDNAYGVSFNYFDQKGTAAFNRFTRGSVRANTSFTRGRFTVGENVALALERSYGGVGNDDFGEGGILGKNILSQPVVPIYDIQGNFASGKAVGLGNNTNPLKAAWAAQDNIGRYNRVFGNVFAGFTPVAAVQLRTRLGFNLSQSVLSGFNAPNPENSEETFTNSIFEEQNNATDWVWANTARLVRSFSRHNFDLLLGHEASAGTNRFLTGSLANILSTTVDSRYIQDALGDATTKNVSSTGGRNALLSFFGKADYNFADRYVASFTLRKDGSSRLSEANRWGTFPAVGLGWRISNEPFMAGNRFLSDAMLRFGWGVTGNQSIPSGRIVSSFGGSRGDTYYDIAGTNNTLVAGFRQTSLGNPNLKWEENVSTNVGADFALFDGKLNVVFDVYRRVTDNLLFDPTTPGTAGIADEPIINVGKMKNTGFDFSIGHQGASWNATFQGSRYKNEIVSIDGVQDFFYGPITTRFGNQVINQVGHPIGSFYGYIADGLFRDAADVAAHATQGGAAPGRIKFRDVDGDGTVTLADRTIIGSPHPDFTAALDLGIRRGNWDLSGTLFGTFGNEIFDVQKEFYIFRNFSTNVRSDLLTDSWTPENPDAKYPRLDQNDVYSNAISSFYVEDGSYIRLRNLQLGYNVAPAVARWLPASRIYLQAENLFTITDYQGLDPALPAANVFGPAGDIRDQYRGVDRGVYPTSKVFSIGIVTSF